MPKSLLSKVAVFAIFLVTVAKASPILTVTLDNQTSHSLGTVAFQHSSGTNTSLSVAGEGVYLKEVPSEVLGITINQQVITKPASRMIALTSGDSVYVGWSDGRIVVIDPTEHW